MLCVIIAAFTGVMANTQAAGPARQGPQLIPRSDEQRQQDYLAEHHAILNIEVTDEGGNPVLDLKPEDFTLVDNGQPRAILSVRAIDRPARPAAPRLVLLLDAVNQPTRQFNADANDVRQYLMREHGELAVPTEIAVFSDAGLKIGEASQDRLVVFEQLESMTRNVRGGSCSNDKTAPLISGAGPVGWATIRPLPNQTLSCLNDRFIRSVWNLQTLALKEENTLGRYILVWIGPGWPLLEGKMFTVDPPELTENYFEYLVSTSTAMREAWVTLDAVSQAGRNSLPDTRKTELLERGVAQQKDMAASDLSLRSLASQSGGLVLDRVDDLPKAIERCVKDAEFYYQLSFDFPASSGPNEFHSIQVKVNRPGLMVRTSTVYYAQP